MNLSPDPVLVGKRRRLADLRYLYGRVVDEIDALTHQVAHAAHPDEHQHTTRLQTIDPEARAELASTIRWPNDSTPRVLERCVKHVRPL